MKAAALGALLVYGTVATAALLFAGNVIQFGGRPDEATSSVPPSLIQAELPKPEVEVAVRSVPVPVRRADPIKHLRSTTKAIVASSGDETKIRTHAADGGSRVIENVRVRNVAPVSTPETKTVLPPVKVVAKRDNVNSIQVDESKGVIYRPATTNQPAAIIYMPKSDPKSREADENREWQEKLRKAMERDRSAGKGF